MKKSASHSAPWGIILFLIFMVLKLTDHIDWSWWWITAPLWIPLLFILAIFLIPLILMGIALLGAFLWDLISDMRNKR